MDPLAIRYTAFLNPPATLENRHHLGLFVGPGNNAVAQGMIHRRMGNHIMYNFGNHIQPVFIAAAAEHSVFPNHTYNEVRIKVYDPNDFPNVQNLVRLQILLNPLPPSLPIAGFGVTDREFIHEERKMSLQRVMGPTRTDRLTLVPTYPGGANLLAKALASVNFRDIEVVELYQDTNNWLTCRELIGELLLEWGVDRTRPFYNILPGQHQFTSVIFRRPPPMNLLPPQPPQPPHGGPGGGGPGAVIMTGASSPNWRQGPGAAGVSSRGAYGGGASGGGASGGVRRVGGMAGYYHTPQQRSYYRARSTTPPPPYYCAGSPKDEEEKKKDG